MTTECPHEKCRVEFDSEHAMKIHYSMKHGESIAKETTTCENCGSEFKYYPSSKEGIHCPTCVENGEHRTVTMHEAECKECGCEFAVTRENAVFCSGGCYIDSYSSTDRASCSECGQGTTKYPVANPLCEVCRQRQAREKRRSKLIEKKGGVCEKCGYDNSTALEFHHIEDTDKSFSLSGNDVLRDLGDVLEEVKKCKLLCRNCHKASHCTGSGFCDHEHGRFSEFSLLD